jgi:hypothetical protein
MHEGGTMHESKQQRRPATNTVAAMVPYCPALCPQGVFYAARKFFALFQQHSTPERIGVENAVREACVWVACQGLAGVCVSRTLAFHIGAH